MTGRIVIETMEVNGLFLHLSKDEYVGFPIATSADASVREFYPFDDLSDTVRLCPFVHMFACPSTLSAPFHQQALVHPYPPHFIRGLLLIIC